MKILTSRASRTDVRGSRAFLAALHLEFNDLAFLQSIKVQLLKTAAVKEYFLAVGGPNKPETTVSDDTLDCALHRHLDWRREKFLADQA